MNCRHCNREIGPVQDYCQYCGEKVHPQMREGGTPSARQPTPWENRANLGFFPSLGATLKECLFGPTAFFRSMPVRGGLIDPLLYSLIISMAGITFSFAWEQLLQGTMRSLLPPEMWGEGVVPVFEGAGLALVALLLPVLLLALLFLETAVIHLLLLLVRGASAGFEGTFRAVAYGNSAAVFFALPLCGGIIGFLWSIVITIIGLKEAHETSGAKAGFAVLMPLVLCCGGVALLVVMGLLASLGSKAGF